MKGTLSLLRTTLLRVAATLRAQGLHKKDLKVALVRVVLVMGNETIILVLDAKCRGIQKNIKISFVY
jgi:hypothetical protein